MNKNIKYKNKLFLFLNEIIFYYDVIENFK